MRVQILRCWGGGQAEASQRLTGLARLGPDGTLCCTVDIQRESHKLGSNTNLSSLIGWRKDIFTWFFHPLPATFSLNTSPLALVLPSAYSRLHRPLQAIRYFSTPFIQDSNSCFLRLTKLYARIVGTNGFTCYSSLTMSHFNWNILEMEYPKLWFQWGNFRWCAKQVWETSEGRMASGSSRNTLPSTRLFH